MINSPELRQDIVSGDWVLVAPERRKRPHQFAVRSRSKPTPPDQCPFENPQKAGNAEPLLWYSRKGEESGPVRKNWVLQVIQNKYPLVTRHKGRVCPLPLPYGLYHKMAGVGFHEVVITRSHKKFLSGMNAVEAELAIRAYQERMLFHMREQCLRYVFVFHNHGEAAGASVWHPHSQIIALPIIPPDVRRSLDGAQRYWQKKHQCVHCEIIDWEITKKERVIHRNKGFVVIAPFASHVSFEMRIFPLQHAARFETISPADRLLLADALTSALGRLKKVLHDPAYNFFIHTAPVEKGKFSYYHWHLEILPKTAHLAGAELGTGIETVTMPPEEAARFFRAQA